MSDLEIYRIMESFNNLTKESIGRPQWATSTPDEDERGASAEEIANAINYRMEINSPHVFSEYGAEAVATAIMDVAMFHEGATELGSSDVSGMVGDVMDQLGRVIEANTTVQTQGNKVIVTKDGNRTEFDDKDTAASFMGDEEDNQFTTESEGASFAPGDTVMQSWEASTSAERKPLVVISSDGVKVTVKDANGKTGWIAVKDLMPFSPIPESIEAEEEVNEEMTADPEAIAEGFGDYDDFDADEAEDSPEYSTFDSENPEHRKRLQRGTPVVLTPSIMKDPEGDRTGIFVSRSTSGHYGTVIRNSDGKQINVHLSDIVSADITNNSIYEEYGVNLEAMLNEDITVTQTTNPDQPGNDTVTITGTGDSVDALTGMLANAGLNSSQGYSEYAPQPAATTDIDSDVDTGAPELSFAIAPAQNDMASLMASCSEPVEEDGRNINHANTPAEYVSSVDAVINGTSGGLNGIKKQYRKEYPGDNPMAVSESDQGASQLFMVRCIGNFWGGKYYETGVDSIVVAANSADEAIEIAKSNIDAVIGHFQNKKIGSRGRPGLRAGDSTVRVTDEAKPMSQTSFHKVLKQDGTVGPVDVASIGESGLELPEAVKGQEFPGDPLDETASFLNLYKSFNERGEKRSQ